MRFREILQEVDEDFTEVELDVIIAEVGSGRKTKIPTNHFCSHLIIIF